MVWIENLSLGITDWHHEACLVMPNSDPEWQSFLSTPYPHDRYFLLHTFWFTTFDFQTRTCYKVTLFPLKSFLWSLKRSTLPATTVRFFTLTSNLQKVTSFFDVTAVKTVVDTWLPIQPMHKYTWFLSGPGWDFMGEIRIVGPVKHKDILNMYARKPLSLYLTSYWLTSGLTLMKCFL